MILIAYDAAGGFFFNATLFGMVSLNFKFSSSLPPAARLALTLVTHIQSGDAVDRIL